MSRRGKDVGFEGVQTWLADWYGDLDDVSLEEIVIEADEISDPEKVFEDPIYQAASKGRQTPLHIYLKYVAYRWMKDELDSPSPRFEAQMYIPNLELIDKFKIRNISDFDIRKPQVLNPGQRNVDATNGEILIIDVMCEDTTFEVGFTTQYNLFTPLIEGLASKVIWLPFPKRTDPRSYDLKTSNLTQFNAYRISINRE